MAWVGILICLQVIAQLLLHKGKGMDIDISLKLPPNKPTNMFTLQLFIDTDTSKILSISIEEVHNYSIAAKSIKVISLGHITEDGTCAMFSLHWRMRTKILKAVNDGELPLTFENNKFYYHKQT